MNELLYQFADLQLSASTLVVFLFLGTFVSEDAACVAAGLAVSNGNISFAAALAACFLGIVAGDMLLFGAGRLIGERIFDTRIVRSLVSPLTQAKAAKWLERNGASAVFLSRFVSGLRLPTYLAAGAFRTSAWRFAVYFSLAAAIWTPLVVGSVAYSLSPGTSSIVIGIAIVLVIRISIKYLSWRNRRVLAGKLKRLVKWEFWPVQIFYLPVVIYILWLGLRHRSLTLFTAANPSLPAGGFKGESKDHIYKMLARSGKNTEFLLSHSLLKGNRPDEERLTIATKFIADNGLSFPLVLKPDAGERGRGVRIIRSDRELADAVTATRRDAILQEHCPGVEISVFYYRRPGDAVGNVFSTTEKVFPTVTGDGRSTVEELILRDPRAVCMAAAYLENLAGETSIVPAPREQITLIDIGTHSRGAIFRDGERLITPELCDTIDSICRSVEGFHFGRFDIKAQSFDAIKAGTFKIIELNGVTSESTNIYDPRYSLIDAYRILFTQWRLAFEIGSANAKRGAKVSSLWELARSVLGQKPQANSAMPATDLAKNGV